MVTAAYLVETQRVMYARCVYPPVDGLAAAVAAAATAAAFVAPVPAAAAAAAAARSTLSPSEKSPSRLFVNVAARGRYRLLTRVTTSLYQDGFSRLGHRPRQTDRASCFGG